MLKTRRILKKVTKILSSREKRNIQIAIGVLTIANLLDLVALFLVGIIGVLTITGTGNGTIDSRGNIAKFLSVTHLQQENIQFQIGILGSIAALLFIGRTVFSLFVVRRIYFFLGGVCSRITKSLILKQFNQPTSDIYKSSSQQLLYKSISGVDSLGLGVIASSITIIADVALLTFICLALALVNLSVTFFTVLFLLAIAAILHYQLGPRTEKLGAERALVSIDLNNRFLQLHDSYREISVRNRKYYMVSQIASLRKRQTQTLAQFAYLPNVSKYVLESSVILGLLILSASQFLLTDAKHAVGTMAIFLAAATRIAPAILRVQQGMMTFRNSIGSASFSISEYEDLQTVQPILTGKIPERHQEHIDFSPTVELNNVTFKYPGSVFPIFENLTLKISEGSLVAIIGKSGMGKSTLIDIMMGLIESNQGNVTISGEVPNIAQMKWAGATAYVPQKVHIFDGTVRENICVGFNPGFFTEQEIWDCLKFAHLDDFISELPDKLESQVGEAGFRLSGGQRQRLGIARAFITNPRLIILDEATNALDEETEADMNKSILKFRGKHTVILVTHTETLLDKADLIISVEKNQVNVHGTYLDFKRYKSNLSELT